MKINDVINKRYSARYMDLEKKISDEDLNTILSSGLKAPSGLATEPWKFYVLKNKQKQLLDATNQEHFLNAPVVVAITYPTSKYVNENIEYLSSKFKTSGFSEDKIDMYINVLNQIGMENYFKEQTPYAGLTMVLQAEDLGINSCICGGFNQDKVVEILNIDKNDEVVSLLITFGYNKQEKADRITRSFVDVVKFID